MQGDLGEASAIEWLTRQGAYVFKPLFHCPDYDLVAEIDGRLVRIEVKTCTRPTPAGNWQVMICTRGGNQSWSGTTKRFDRMRCEFLFVLVGDGRRWFIPTDQIEAETAIVVGGRKFSEYEIEKGTPLPARTRQQAASTIASR